MTTLLLATTNPHKVREIRQLLAGAPVQIVTLARWPGLAAPEETGLTFEDNARAKAFYYAAATGELTVAEDSGLSIDALDGAPGVESARFGGAELSYPGKFALIDAALRAAGVRCRLVGGLAGPTKLSSLIKYAMRCGAGPSVRALSSRPASFARLLADHGPEGVLRSLAQAQLDGSSDFAGIHLFCFGGYLRTCQWLLAIAQGRFELDDNDGFKV